MTSTTQHGGKRVGSGRKKLTERRITVRVSPETESVLQEFDLARSPSEALRHFIEFSHCPAQEALAEGVLARFMPTREGETFSARLAAVYGNGPIWLYPSGIGGKTVKARIPLNDTTSAWVSIPNLRLKPPSDAERANEEQKIAEAITLKLGIPAQWVPLPPPTYTLDELLARSDYSQPLPASEREWIDTPAHGNEII